VPENYSLNLISFPYFKVLMPFLVNIMNKQIGVLFLLISVFFLNFTNAQNAKVDSLENVLKIHKTDDTIKVNLLNQIAYLIYQKDSGKAQNYAAQAGELSDKLFFLKGKAESYWVIGTSILYNKSDRLALDYFLKALKIAEEINNKPKTVKYLIGCGMIYKSLGNNSTAIECYEKAIKIAEEFSDKSLLAAALTNISIVYSSEGNADKALEGYQKVLDVSGASVKKTTIARVLNNMGAIYGNQGNRPKSLEYHFKALKISEEVNDRLGILLSFTAIGMANIGSADYQIALEYLQKALKIAEELKNKRKIALCLTTIGDIYIQTNNSQALEYFNKALVIAEEMADKFSLIYALMKIGDVYQAQGDFEKALLKYSSACELLV